MPWDAKSVMDTRIEFVIRASQGLESMSSLCREFRISRPTGYLWLRRYEELGTVIGLEERSRRPHRSPSKTAVDLERRVVSLRRRWGWGAKKLHVLLKLDGIDIPIPTINRIIRRNGLILPECSSRRHFRRFERSKPNELWQMDFKGEFLHGKRKCYPLSIIDDHSRYVVGLHALSSTGGDVVKRCIIDTFQENGLPERILMDHGSPWWGAGGELGLSKLSVALLKMGVKLSYSGVGHPQTQGKVERFHRTLKEEVLRRGFPPAFSGWGALLEQIRHDYNHIRPHEAIDFKTPVQVYQKSEKPYQGCIPWIYDPDLDVTDVYENGSVYYAKKQFFLSNALLGQQVGIKHNDDKIDIYFRDMLIREVDMTTRRGRQIASNPLRRD